jgi:hypothetical protein
MSDMAGRETPGRQSLHHGCVVIRPVDAAGYGIAFTYDGTSAYAAVQNAEHRH